MSENQKDLVNTNNQHVSCENGLEHNNSEEEISSNKNKVVSLASKQINNVIEFQEPSTSTNYSFKTEIRINILGEPKSSQKSIDTDDSITLSLFNEDRKPKKEPVAVEESFTTMDYCIKEKMTNTNEPTMFSRDNRTQRAVVGSSEAPPPYHSYPPPAYSASPYQSSAPVNREITGSDPEDRYFYYTPDYSRVNTVQTRHIFIQKVFLILCVQLMVTIGAILLAMFHAPTKYFMGTNMVTFWVTFALFFITYIILACYQIVRRFFPVNLILLGILTISLSYICAATTVYFSTRVILTTAGATALICLVVTLLACQTWFDVTKWGFIIAIASIIFCLFGLVTLIVYLITWSEILWLVYSGIATVFFAVYLLYDMQLILGGRRYELSTDEYILGAICLFVDIVMIFMYMLNLVNACSR